MIKWFSGRVSRWCKSTDLVMLLKRLRILIAEEIKRELLKLYKIKVTNPIPEHEFDWHPSTLLKEMNFSLHSLQPLKKKKKCF